MQYIKASFTNYFCPFTGSIAKYKSFREAAKNPISATGIRKFLNSRNIEVKPYKLQCSALKNDLKSLSDIDNSAQFQIFNSAGSANKQKILKIDYPLESFHRSNQDTSLVHKPAVFEGQWVESGDLLADCSTSVGGDLSLGQNLLIGYMPWEGYNFEDAILISERLVYDDLYTSVHIEKYEVEIRETELGIEQLTNSIPQVNEDELTHLNSDGIAFLGSWVEEGDILVGKVTPIKKKEESSYQKLLYTILDKKFIPVRDSSFRASKGIKAKVINIQYNGVKVNKPKMSAAVSKTKKSSSIKQTGKIFSNKKIVNPFKTKQNPDLLKFLTSVSKASNPFFNNKGLSCNRKKGSQSHYYFSQFSYTAKLMTYIAAQLSQSEIEQTFNQLKKNDSKINSLLITQQHILKSLKKTQINNCSNKSSAAYTTGQYIKGRLKSLDKLTSTLNSSEKFLFLAKWNLLSLKKRKKTAYGQRPYLQSESNLSLDRSLYLKKAAYGVWPFSQDRKNGNKVAKKVNPNQINLNKKEAAITLNRKDINRSWPKAISDGSLQKISGADLKPLFSIEGLKSLKNRIFFLSSLIKNKNAIPSDTSVKSITVYLADKRKIQVGDKMSGRHGNKGIVSQILPREDMPYLPDGTPLDMVLNPLGVPSRMNVGQIYECLLGFAGKYLGEKLRILPFDEIYGPEASRSFVYSKLYEARVKTGCDWLYDPTNPGKMRLYDGRTGDCFDQNVTVGQSYILRLVHMVDDKIHARSTGPYSLVNQQPLRGRSKKGGQRLGEMEVWALEGYGAAFTLLEMLTIKSDDMTGRMTLWSNLLLNKDLSIGTPESFKVLICELQALCLDIGLFRPNPLKKYRLEKIENLIQLR